MTFAITKFIHPLEQPVELSKHLNYVFDNPRNEAEIAIVKRFVYSVLENQKKDKDSTLLPFHTRIVWSIFDLKEVLNENDPNGYQLKYYTSNESEEKHIFELIVQTWVIVRMPELPLFKNLSTDKSLLFHTMFGKDQSEYTSAFSELANYCHVVSLLANNDENYHGESFLLNKDPYEIFFPASNEKVKEAVDQFISYNQMVKHGENRVINWLHWNDGFENIVKQAARVDSLAIQQLSTDPKLKKRLSQRQTPRQKLIHIGGLLKTAYEHLQDPELMLLLSVSIIEYLLTRNPDNSRYNVEDSISKQFKLKCAVLIHSFDKTYDLEELKDQLTKIYEQRSDLAHGNYRDNFDIKEIVKSVFLLFEINQKLLNVFIDDRQFVEYLKDN